MTSPTDRLRVALAGRYRLDREIGAGGMATVYLAEDLRHHRKVALKVLRPNLAAVLGPDRFLREITIAAGLAHPHIVPLHDSGEADGMLFYVMPYVEGESLRERLVREGELPIVDAMRILRDVADGLAYAHGHGVVHRDIKPENVMLAGRHALVTDFGVARAVSEATDRRALTTAGVALGTPAYMAPEQATGDPHTDHRADIYAWGVLAYEVLTGRPPFTYNTAPAVLAAHLTEKVESVLRHRPNVPPELAALVMGALEKKPADRLQSAEALIAQLDGILTPSGGTTPTATRRVTRETTTTAAARGGRRLWATAVVCVGLVAGAAYWFLGRSPATDPALVMVAPFENRTGDPSLDWLGLALAEQVTLALAGHGTGEPVPAARLRELVASAPAGSPALTRSVAKRSGAGLLISGSYGGGKEALEVRAELLRMPEGRQVSLIEAVKGPEGAVLSDSLGERLAVAVAATADWGDRFGWGTEHRLPRSLAAYRAGVEGDAEAAKGNTEGAAEHYRRALASDSGYPWARIGLWWRCWGCVSVQASFSLLDELRTQAASWLPGDRALLDIWSAWRAQDWERAYKSLVTRLAVDTLSWLSLAARAAYYSNRLEEVVRLGARRNEPSYWTASHRRTGRLHFDLGNALHGLGRDQEALEVALETRRDFPDMLTSITLRFGAHAGLGHVAEVERLVAEVEGMRPSDATSLQENVSRALIAAVELKAHSQPDAAKRVLRREVAGFRHRLKQDPSDYRLQEGLEHLLSEAEQWDDLLKEARKAEALRPPAPYGVIALQHQAMAYAGLGEADSVRALLRRSQRVGAGGGEPWDDFGLAGIMVRLGDSLKAMDHFRSSWAAGDPLARGHHQRHRTPVGIALRDYPPFVHLTRTRQ